MSLHRGSHLQEDTCEVISTLRRLLDTTESEIMARDSKVKTEVKAAALKTIQQFCSTFSEKFPFAEEPTRMNTYQWPNSMTEPKASLYVQSMQMPINIYKPLSTLPSAPLSLAKHGPATFTENTVQVEPKVSDVTPAKSFKKAQSPYALGKQLASMSLTKEPHGAGQPLGFSPGAPNTGGVSACAVDLSRRSGLSEGNVVNRVTPSATKKRAPAKRDESPSKRTCPTCNRQFTQRGSLQRHIRAHDGVRPYSCDICNKSFADRERVKVHKRTHTGEKPFACTICNTRFSQKSTVTRHLAVHFRNKKTDLKTNQNQSPRNSTGDSSMSPMDFSRSSSAANSSSESSM